MICFTSRTCRTIPLEKALPALDEFAFRTGMKGFDIGNLRSAGIFIEKTRSAYILNFKEGFAILGASSSVPDIIAVAEKGSIDSGTLAVRPAGDFPASPFRYSIEDDDWYTAEKAGAAGIVSRLVLTGMEENEYQEMRIAERPLYAECSPLVPVNWGQREPYNRYCLRKNLNMQKRPAWTGCSTTAMAMIAARNAFPHSLIINGEKLSWNRMTSVPDANSLPEEYRDQVALLMGAIYSGVDKIAVNGWTLITPEQIRKRMMDFKYENIVKMKGAEFSGKMLKAVEAMLSERKPVFLSAIPPDMNGHSWVVDGAKYSPQGGLLLHFNFGWDGDCNGWFSTACLNPAKGAEYDRVSPDNVSPRHNGTFSWHFRLLTYDVPRTPASFRLDLKP